MKPKLSRFACSEKKCDVASIEASDLCKMINVYKFVPINRPQFGNYLGALGKYIMRRNKNNRYKAIVVSTGILFTFVLQGCASTVLKQVSESNRDETGQYDGNWKGTIKSTASKQSLGGNWTLTCGDRAGTNLGIISVVDGVATIGKRNISTAFVNQSGKFRFEIPIEEVAAASGTSDATISNGKMTILMYGSLESGTGKYTLGIAQFGNNGCSSKVVYERV